MGIQFCFAAGSMVVLLILQRVLRGLGRKTLGARSGARDLADAAEVVAIFMIAAQAATGCVGGYDLPMDALRVLAFGGTAALLLHVAGRQGVRLLFRGRLEMELAEGNSAAGVAAAAHVLATGVIAARLFKGEAWEDLGASLLFFVIAQASLHVLVWLFRMLTVYDDAEEILDHNLAAGLSYAGVTLAAGLLVAYAVDGTCVTIGDSLYRYGVALLLGLALYPVRQILVPLLFLGAAPRLRGGPLDRAISEERNVGMAALEAATYVGTALMVNAWS